MVPIRLIIVGWRKGVSKLDAALVDKEDEEAVQEYEKRRGTKHGILKAPYVLLNLFKKIGGGGKKKKSKGSGQAAGQEEEDPNVVPQAVPLPANNGGQASYAVI